MGDLFAKNLKKQSARAKEKFLVSLGKADQTVDEEFDEYAANFTRQLKANDRLHKELKNYASCIKEAVRETYEAEWPGGEHVRAMSQSLDLVWDDFHEKMNAQVLNPIAAHANQFTEMHKKIAKRGRKLVDYDGARHTYDASKTHSDVKQHKAQEQMLVAKKMYEDLNQELRDELPALYDSRITFYVNTMQSVFNLEQTFHSETAKLSRELCVQMDELGHALGRLRVPRSRTDSLPTAIPQSALNNNHKPAKPQQPPPEQPKEVVYPNDVVEKLSAEAKSNGSGSGGSKPGSVGGSTPGSIGGSKPASLNGDKEVKRRDSLQPPPEVANPFGSSDSEPGSRRESAEPEPVERVVESDVVERAEEKVEEPVKPVKVEKEEKVDEVEKIEAKPDASETVTDSKSTVLYRVRATHRYAAEDADELSFEAGEIIDVIPFEDPEEEQDEGWLFGRKEANSSQKGVFPANFTKPI